MGDELGHSGEGIDRRQLLYWSAAAGLTAAAGAAAPVARSSAADERMPANPPQIEEATVGQLQAAMAAGTLTACALAEAYLGRIAAVDGDLRSVIELNPEALEIAAALDKERAATGPRGPLHGIPVLIKDNIATADRMETTAGSLALVGARPPRDAHVAARLRRAGAVLLGKSNLSEWANFRSSHSSSGWSGRGGQCRNPYALDRSPCGSSSGSGAAVSANLAALAVGTETDGSVVCPSATCGVVGIKPTLGLLSRAGIVPIAHSQDTAGPMARTVADAALLLGALAGLDERDPATAVLRDRTVPDYVSAVDPKGLEGARLGVARGPFAGYSPEADAILEKALAAMRKAGAELVDPVEIPHAGEYDDAEMEVLLYEFKADLDAYLAALGPGAPVHSLAEVIAFNQAHADAEMRFFGQDLFLRAQAKGPLTDAAYTDALATCRRLSRTEGLDAAFAAHRLDAIVALTGGPAWTIDLVNGDHFLGASSTPCAVSGYPAVTVPAGLTFGLPVGVTFMGRAFREPQLIRLAAGFEAVTRARTAPRLPAGADLAS